MSIFSVSIGKEQLCFTAAHFIAFKGFREPLHGHTYQVQVTVSGPVGPDGYVVDFLVLKKIAEEECRTLHFRTLLPEQSDCLVIKADKETVQVECEDGAQFNFPRQDVCLGANERSSAPSAPMTWMGRPVPPAVPNKTYDPSESTVIP